MKTLLLAFACALSLAGEEPKFPDSKQVEGQNLVLNGTGMRKATFLGIKVYKAGLYLKEKTNDADKALAAPLPKFLEMKFVHDVSADKLRGAWTDSLKDNNSDFDKHKANLDKLNGAMKDVKEGDVLSFTFSGKNTNVAFGEQVAVKIEGADFQTALLRIWLGPKPPNEDLKKGLLSTLP